MRLVESTVEVLPCPCRPKQGQHACVRRTRVGRSRITGGVLPHLVEFNFKAFDVRIHIQISTYSKYLSTLIGREIEIEKTLSATVNQYRQRSVYTPNCIYYGPVALLTSIARREVQYSPLLCLRYRCNTMQ